MKLIPVFLLLAFIVALVMEPGHRDFNQFLAKKGRNSGTCLGGTRHNSYKVFTIDYVDYCDQSDSTLTGRFNGTKKIRTDRYFGIFGSFWKM
jgi:hypothetical protein